MSYQDAPQIGDLHTSGEFHPNLSNNTGSGGYTASNGQLDGTAVENAKNNIYGTAQSAMNTVQNHPMTQNVKNAYNDSPVGQVVSDESAKTSNEFRDLANARQTPNHSAATGQPLTHYHSLFYRLLSWKNPRATAITFATTVIFIFLARYLHIVRYVLKGLYVVLGVTAAAEAAGKVAFGNGLTSQIRPKKYYTISKDSLSRFMDDIEQLINFGVIEAQRIVFAENVYVTGAAFVASFLAYYLIKFVPLWGMSLIITSVMYLAPLIYIKNKSFIDHHLNNAGTIINQQATQVKDLTAHHTGRALETTKTYASEYSNKAQGLMGTAQRKASSAAGQAQSQVSSAAGQAQSRVSSAAGQAQSQLPSQVQSSDFPRAPREEPVADAQVPAPQPEYTPAY